MLFEAAGIVQMAGDENLIARDSSAVPSESVNLVVRARAGDSSAFEQLMILYQRQVLCTAVRILRSDEDAKDAAQEVFIKLYRYLLKIHPETVRPWLYRVTVNICRDMARRGGRLPAATLADQAAGNELSIAAMERTDAGLDLKEQQEILHSALQALPFKERAALVLRDIEGLSTEETAGILGSSAVTVRSQISSARMKVKHFCERAMGKSK